MSGLMIVGGCIGMVGMVAEVRVADASVVGPMGRWSGAWARGCLGGWVSE